MNLVTNSDSVLFLSHIVDLFGDPLENKTTTIELDMPDKKVKRGGTGGIVYSNADGNANYPSMDQGLTAQTWLGQFETCTDQHSIDVQYYYDVECNASTVSPTVDELSIESPLVISAHYETGVGGLQGATINVYWTGGSTQMFLDENGNANATVTYLGGTPTNQIYTLDVDAPSETCEKTINVYWIRTCNTNETTLSLSSTSLTTDEQLHVTLTVNDSNGLNMEGVEVTIEGSLHNTTSSGTTDVNGQYKWDPPAPESTGIETFTATIVGGCTKTSQMTWSSPATTLV